MVPGLVSPGLLAFLLVFWIAMCLLWTPLLASKAIRRLLGGWPTHRLAVNYAVGMALVTGAHFTLVAAVLFALSQEGQGVNLLEFFKLVLAVTGGLLAVVWMGLSVGLPRLGRWDPTADGYDGRLVLVVGVVWYLVCTAFVTAVINFVAFLFAFPG